NLARQLRSRVAHGGDVVRTPRRRSGRTPRLRSEWTVGFLLAAVLAVPAVAGGQAPDASVQALLADASVKSALETARSSESQTIEDQIRFCEVPAPPFKEAARAQVLRREFTRIG